MIDTIGRALSPVKHTTSVAREPIDPGAYDSLEGAPKKTIQVDQSKRGISSPSNYLNLNKPLAKLYAESDDAKALGLNIKAVGARCSVCRGGGSIRIDMGFLPDVHVECETCRGTGYTPEAWDIKLHGYSLPEITTLTIEETYNLFKDKENIARPLKAAIDVGLGYLVMKQPGYSLSGGEAQRLKIAKELSKKTNSGSLYILDEPTVGLHLEDVEQLIDVLNRLVDDGNSVIVIEHHPHLLASCDWLLELGPGGGPEGGKVVAQGTPTEISKMETATAPYINEVLGGS
jgi:excinuclease ABC subunit A